MRQYKGYYIDGAVFNSEKEIDAFLKEQAIAKYKTLATMFARKPSAELIVVMQVYFDRLHNEFGLSYEEIESIEIEAAKIA